MIYNKTKLNKYKRPFFLKKFLKKSNRIQNQNQKIKIPFCYNSKNAMKKQ